MYRQISEKRKHEPNDAGLGHGGRTAGCESRVGHSVSLRVEREKKSWPAGVQSLAFARRLNVGRGRLPPRNSSGGSRSPLFDASRLRQAINQRVCASIPRASREARCLITRTSRQSRNTRSPCFGPEPRQPQRRRAQRCCFVGRGSDHGCR